MVIYLLCIMYDFICHVAGTKEPLESSQGNTQLLPRFSVCLS